MEFSEYSGASTKPGRKEEKAIKETTKKQANKKTNKI